MGWLSALLGGGTKSPIEAVGSAIDELITSDEERAQAEAVLEKLRQQPHILQAEINKIEAGHRTLFVAGWRPAIGWICALGLSVPFIVNPVLQWATGEPGPTLPLDDLTPLVYALLGLGGLRTFEKVNGKAK